MTPRNPNIGNIVANLLELGPYARRAVAEILTEAEHDYWIKRAHDFQQALSRPGDYLGQRTPEQQAQADAEIRDIIRNCLHRAALCGPYNDEEVAA